MKRDVLSCLVVFAAVVFAACGHEPEPASDAAGADFLVDRLSELSGGELDFNTVEDHCDYCRDFVTHDDPLARAAPAGIVWYGVWEDAVRESQRTGRPILLHFGSPRVMEVCGVW